MRLRKPRHTTDIHSDRNYDPPGPQQISPVIFVGENGGLLLVGMLLVRTIRKEEIAELVQNLPDCFVLYRYMGGQHG
jgi:hypothetical protein